MASKAEKDSELTMCDVLEEEQELEDDANAVLGGSDDTNCSYDQGYIPRQALYACMTCCPEVEAGVCLACCLSCHDKHEVVELYTKRNFRCDCGNSKFKGKKCNLVPSKSATNEDNRYNHNFKGLYCTCHRPYPDLEDNTPDEMIQCIMCEDWYHGRHLGSKVPEEYSEMICQTCMDSHRFLRFYQSSYNIQVDYSPSKMKLRSCNGSVDKKEDIEMKDIKQEAVSLQDDSISEENEKKNDSGEMKDIPDAETLNSGTKLSEETKNAMSNVKKEVHCNESEVGIEIENSILDSIVKNETTDDTSNAAPVKDELNNFPSCSSTSNTDESQSAILKKMENNGNQCVFKLLNDSSSLKGSAFWPEKWRQDLCCCYECKELYASQGCSYLLDLDDTIHSYESKGKTKSKSQYDEGMSALSQLDRVKQMEAVTAYTNMKGELLDYLKGFAENKQTVCESDIKEFFEKMSKKKKLNNGVPHYCR